MYSRRTLLHTSALTALGTGWCLDALAQAEAYPSKPIQVVIPFPPGGIVDNVFRAVSPGLSAALGQPLVVDNKPGAGGSIGAGLAAKAKPDGYTLLMVFDTFALNVAVYRKLPYDLLKDLQTITLVGQTGVVLVTHPSLKPRQVSELVELAKEKPGELNYGSAGLGSPQHLQSEFFNQLVSIKTNHIPYKGQSQAMNDLVGGQLNYMFSPIQNALPFIRQERIRALAVASAQRHPALPNVPTLAEAGYRGVELTNWFALYAPAGTPTAIVKKLNAAFVKVGKSPEMLEKFEKLGFDPFFTTPEEGTDFMRAELVRWARVAAHAGIKAE